MDPLSITASTITVLALATKTTVLAQEIISSTKEAPSELTDLRNEISSLIWVTSRLDALAKEEAKTFSYSAQKQNQILWLQNVTSAGEAKSDIEVALEACTKTMMQLTAKLDKMSEYLTSGNPLDKVKFPIFVAREKGNLKDLRTKLVQSKTAILMCLQMRTFDMLKTASSTSTEHKTDIQELLKLVRSLKPQNQTTEVSGVVHETIEPAAGMLDDMSVTTAADDHDDEQEKETAGIENGKRTFELETYSGPEVWMQKFR